MEMHAADVRAMIVRRLSEVGEVGTVGGFCMACFGITRSGKLTIGQRLTRP